MIYLRQLVAEISPRVVDVELVDEVELGHVFLRIYWVSPASYHLNNAS
jgi:hypothetical protein